VEYDRNPARIIPESALATIGDRTFMISMTIGFRTLDHAAEKEQPNSRPEGSGQGENYEYNCREGQPYTQMSNVRIYKTRCSIAR